MKRVMTTIYLEQEQLDYLKNYSNDSMSSIIRVLIDKFKKENGNSTKKN